MRIAFEHMMADIRYRELGGALGNFLLLIPLCLWEVVKLVLRIVAMPFITAWALFSHQDSDGIFAIVCCLPALIIMAMIVMVMA